MTDSKLIGTWRRSDVGLEATFLADHTFHFTTPSGETASGTWNLNDHALTTIIPPKVRTLGEHGDGSTIEVHTITLRGTQLVMTPKPYNDKIVYDRIE